MEMRSHAPSSPAMTKPNCATGRLMSTNGSRNVAARSPAARINAEPTMMDATTTLNASRLLTASSLRSACPSDRTSIPSVSSPRPNCSERSSTRRGITRSSASTSRAERTASPSRRLGA